MQYRYIYDSFDYQTAVNYTGTSYFNPPIMLEVNNALFILPFGTSDKKTVKFEGNHMFIVGENNALDYISMVCIDLTDNSIESCFLDSMSIDEEPGHLTSGILDKETDEQIKILCEFLPSNY